MSAFALKDGVVYHTYSAYARGLDVLWTTYQWLDGGKGKYEKVARRVVMRQNTVGTYYWIATILWSPDRYVTRTTRGGATSSVVAASGVTDA